MPPRNEPRGKGRGRPRREPVIPPVDPDSSSGEDVPVERESSEEREATPPLREHRRARHEQPRAPPREVDPPYPEGVDPWDIVQGLLGRPGAPVAPPQVALTDFVERATRHHPPTYSGQTDPTVLDDWAYRMRNILEDIGCPPEQRVRVASRYLVRRAMQWWRTMGADPTIQPEQDWDRFVTVLGDYFYPARFRAAKRKEFRTFVQRDDMDVTTYYHQSVELMRHGMDLVPDDRAKVQKFEEGLYPTIRLESGSTTLRAAYEHALFTEQAERDRQAYYDRRRSGREGRGGFRQRDDRGFRGQRRQESGRGGGRYGGGVTQRQIVGGSSQIRQGIQCYRCQGWGHRIQEYRWRLGVILFTQT